MWKSFWDWYERTYILNVSIALFLFALQFVHLFWLFGEVIMQKLFGVPLFSLHGVWENVIVLVDYTEIPALLSISLVYINDIRKGGGVWAWAYLFMLLSQFLHIFWITDEFVVTAFNSGGTILPAWLAWVAILIDYLEVPVIIDTVRKLYVALKNREGLSSVREALSEGE